MKTKIEDGITYYLVAAEWLTLKQLDKRVGYGNAYMRVNKLQY